MGQIVRRKKGRPSKADLGRRNAATATPSAAESESDLRRSLRRRNVRYTFDFDDYIDEDDEDEQRREKKLKLLLKLQGNEEDGAELTPSETRRVTHAPTASASSSDNKPLKKRKIGGDVDEDNNIDDVVDDDEEEEVRGRKSEPERVDSVPGTPTDPPFGVPLPDKNILEMILDKLQKKDIYGVYAEPVDPEELPDYHDVIKEPMDFATVRNKLGNGIYSTLEQFENDVFLICTNAMEYNAPDTIYFKQASSIQELAKRKFQRLRIDIEQSEKELKSEQKTMEEANEPMISNLLAKKQTRKRVSRTVQESVGSDLSSGPTLATAGDFQHGSSVAQGVEYERTGSVDGFIEGKFSLINNNLDKGEEVLPGKGVLSRLGRNPSVHDENRHVTYYICNQPVDSSESILTIFEGESKHLVPVGLHADHSYARSLARFAATLGSLAWKVASQRIEQTLPAGFKFGHGWVGEYEPLPTPVLMLENSLPTPVLMLENCNLKDPASLTWFQCTAGVRKDGKTCNSPVSSSELPVTVPTSEGKSPLFSPVETRPTTIFRTSISLPAKEEPVRGSNLDAKPSLTCSPGTKPTDFVKANYQPQNPRSRNFVEPEKQVSQQVKLNCPPSANQSTADFVAERQISNGLEPAVSRSFETVSGNRNILQSASFRLPNINGVVAGGLPSGKAVSNTLDSIKMVTSCSDSLPNELARAETYFSHGQELGLSDPVQLMRMLAEKAQNEHKSSNNSPVDLKPFPSLGSEESNNAAAAAARACMSIGAGGLKPTAETGTQKSQISADSLYNPTHDRQPQVSRFRGEFPVSGMHFQADKNSFPLHHAFMPQPVRMGNEAQFQNQPMVFPQFVTADLSRFQMKSPSWGLNQQTQTRHKRASLPPDLNIGFQSSGSPVRQSSGVLVDSQQPDLALQL